MEKKENISKKISWDESRNFRFRRFFEESGVNQEEFSDKSGLPQPNLSAILNNKRALGEKTIDKYIIPVFPELNKMWLLTGKGTMFINDNSGFASGKNIISGTNHRINQGGVYKEENIPIDLLDIIRKKDEQIAQKDEQINKLIELLSNK